MDSLDSLDLAIENLDHAWTDMPQNARKKVIQPSLQVSEQVKSRVWTEAKMIRWRAYRKMSAENRQDIRDNQEIIIAKEMVLKIKIQIYNAMEECGYLLSGIRPQVGKDGWSSKKQTLR